LTLNKVERAKFALRAVSANVGYKGKEPLQFVEEKAKIIANYYTNLK